MTKFHYRLPVLACAAALTIGAAPASAYVLERVYVKSWSTSGTVDDLPGEPNIAAPGAGPLRKRPPMVTFTWGSKMPVFHTKPAGPAKVQAIKAK